MFSHLGWGEIAVLAVVGLIIFGPDRLPRAVADAARLMRQLRTMARGAAADLKAELGPEMADLDLASLHPRRMMGSLFDEDPLPAPLPAQVPAEPTTLAVGEAPPYDEDAT